MSADDDMMFPFDTDGSFEDRHGNDKFKEDSDHHVSYTPTYDYKEEESDLGTRRPSKIPKINKDGAPRKPRQPRPKLLKWTDTDWKNVVLGIVWACGETGLQIPFDQAAQVVGESCTAGALQQAILKLRCKQMAEGYNIPTLKMAWSRKRKDSTSPPSSNANAMIMQDREDSDDSAVETPTSAQSSDQCNQKLIVKLKVSNRILEARGIPIAPGPTQDLNLVPSARPVNDHWTKRVWEHDVAVNAQYVNGEKVFRGPSAADTFNAAYRARQEAEAEAEAARKAEAAEAARKAEAARTAKMETDNKAAGSYKYFQEAAPRFGPRTLYRDMFDDAAVSFNNSSTALNVDAHADSFNDSSRCSTLVNDNADFNDSFTARVHDNADFNDFSTTLVNGHVDFNDSYTALVNDAADFNDSSTARVNVDANGTDGENNGNENVGYFTAFKLRFQRMFRHLNVFTT
ncbi:hypothetical protein BDW02DRAFT_573654 [Decorospora gaudefroyi]|uniref:Uncharacterized protein n=1 Tax=Decorospora gaudefroyi TaxID=184978 RepID=A0A6A5K0Q3_9PLEO|nr:hypothetical protein BDW02DRAFT_573654 [Decorospora gaudefroyi]